MNYYSRLSIKTKIILLAVFISTFVSLVSIFIFYSYDKQEIMKREIRDVSTVSSLVSNYSGLYVEFDRPLDVQKIVNSFVTLSHITQVKVFKFDTVSHRHLEYPYAQHLQEGEERKQFMPFNEPKDTVIFTSTSFAIYKSIPNRANQKENVGTIILVASLDFYQTQKNHVWFIALGMFLGSIVLSTLLVVALQGYISKPVLELSEKVYSISEAKNYGIDRQPRGSRDEIFRLSVAFKQMLHKIESDNAQLIKAKEAALESVRAKDDFLAKMSHEIRTPLNAVMGLSNLLKQTTLSEDQVFYVDNIKTSSENLLVIINEILDFSKIQVGKLKIDRITFDLHKVLNNYKNSIDIGIDERKLGFNFNVPEAIPRWVYGDPVRLNQVLLNLSSNALKFTDVGEITFDVEVLEMEEDTVRLKFSITDTGIGIKEAQLDNIFESFNQASNSTTRKYGGTGLGLTISKQLVDLQGGNISVKSEYGVGSTFSFELGFDIALTPDDIEDSIQDYAAVEEEISKRGLRVLLVEDNRLNRLLARRILEKLNITVLEAKEGRAAIRLLREESVDLILMDLHMPEMDGYSTTKYIRNNFKPPVKDLPIIALTAAATKGEVDKCFEYGMNEFVSKPINTQTLVEKIHKIANLIE